MDARDLAYREEIQEMRKLKRLEGMVTLRNERAVLPNNIVYFKAAWPARSVRQMHVAQERARRNRLDLYILELMVEAKEKGGEKKGKGNWRKRWSRRCRRRRRRHCRCN